MRDDEKKKKKQIGTKSGRKKKLSLVIVVIIKKEKKPRLGYIAVTTGKIIPQSIIITLKRTGPECRPFCRDIIVRLLR